MIIVDEKKDGALYRPCVGICVRRPLDGKILAGQRCDDQSNTLQLPQGGLDLGESYWDCALRELKEEVGTDKVRYVQELDHLIYYQVPHEFAQKAWGGNFIGQKQKWFLVDFIGTDEDINVCTASPEFVSCVWITFGELLERCIFFKKKVYQFLAQEFKMDV